MDSVTHKMAEFTAALRFEDMPNEVIHEAKRNILDVIGCALGGTQHEIGKITLELVTELGGKAEATVIGTGERTSSVNAAYANSRLANALDMDDTFLTSGHFGNGALAAPLALCERQGGTGKDLITCFVAGFEIASVVAEALVCQDLHPSGSNLVEEGGVKRYAKYFSPAALTVAAAAAGSARALWLDVDRTYHALGIAGGNIPIATMRKWAETKRPLPLFKYADMGWCAQTGVTAALLAQKGTTALEDIFDGDAGVVAALGVPTDQCDLSPFVNQLGTSWNVPKTSYKGWPSCRMTHSALTAFTRIMRDNHLKPDEIERVVIRGNPVAIAPRFATQEPVGPVSSEFSLCHSIAMVALGIKRPLWHTAEVAADRMVQNFRRRVFTELEDEKEAQEVRLLIPHAGMFLPPALEVKARGQIFRDRALFAWGDPEPETCLTQDDLRTKFSELAEAIRPDSKKWRNQIIQAIEILENLERVKDLKELMRLLSPNSA